MTENAKEPLIKIDDVNYDMDDLSDNAKAQIRAIQFSDRQILHLQNELAISNTARNGYLRAIKSERGHSVGAGG